MLVCASVLTQAAPLLNSTNVCNTTLATVTDVDKPVDYNSSTDGSKLVLKREEPITMYSRLTNAGILKLASTAVLSVTSISYSGNVPAPQIDGSIATALNNLGDYLGTNSLATSGSLPQSINSNPPLGTLWMTWDTPSAQTLNLSGLEWTTVLTAMYRALAYQTSLGDYIQVAFDVGGIALNVALGLQN